MEPKPAARSANLMSSGTAIPWEDRGSLGFFPAFFGTAFGIMFKPVAMLTKMRRPETANDANIFAYAVAALWFLSVLIQSAFAYFVFYTRDHTLYVDNQQYMINTLLEALLAGAAAAFMPRIISWIFYRLTAFDMTSKAPPVLVYNCITFLTGVSVLALLPGLRIRVGAAIIGSTLTFLATSGLIILAIYAIQFLWCSVIGYASLTPAIPLTPNH